MFLIYLCHTRKKDPLIYHVWKHDFFPFINDLRSFMFSQLLNQQANFFVRTIPPSLFKQGHKVFLPNKRLPIVGLQLIHVLLAQLLFHFQTLAMFENCMKYYSSQINRVDHGNFGGKHTWKQHPALFDNELVNWWESVVVGNQFLNFTRDAWKQYPTPHGFNVFLASNLHHAEPQGKMKIYRSDWREFKPLLPNYHRVIRHGLQVSNKDKPTTQFFHSFLTYQQLWQLVWVIWCYMGIVFLGTRVRVAGNTSWNYFLVHGALDS